MIAVDGALFVLAAAILVLLFIFVSSILRYLLLSFVVFVGMHTGWQKLPEVERVNRAEAWAKRLGF